MPILLQLQKLPWKGDGGGGGGSLRRFKFWLSRRLRVHRKKTWCVLGHPIARATSYCLLSFTLWLRASKNAFKVGSVKFANSLSPPSTVKKVHTGSKSCQGTDLSDAGQKSRELTTPPESPNRDRQKLCTISKQLHSSFICMRKKVRFSLKFIAVDVRVLWGCAHIIVHVCAYAAWIRTNERVYASVFHSLMSDANK